MQNAGVYIAVVCVILAAGAWVLAGRKKSKASEIPVGSSRMATPPSLTPPATKSDSAEALPATSNPAPPAEALPASKPATPSARTSAKPLTSPTAADSPESKTASAPPKPAESRSQKPLNLNSNDALEKHKEEFRKQKAARGESSESTPIVSTYTEAPAEEEAKSGLVALEKAEASLATLSSRIAAELSVDATVESKKQSLSACKQQAHQILNALDEIATGDIEDDTLREAAKARKKAVTVGVNAAVARLAKM